MPYNTRRKSLSLPSLGIHVPVTHAARAAAAAAAAAANRPSPTSSHSPRVPSAMASPPSGSRHAAAEDVHSSRKLKRAHSDDSDDALPVQPLPKKRDARNGAVRNFDNTPPPSPLGDGASVDMDDADSPAPKPIDLDSIHDEIVEAVIVQLQKTGNRPHLVKELAAVLMQQLRIVQQSANPCAIISSRLSTFLKRSCWSASAPAPLAKELETVHPRRTYFYLTTCPHQPLPDPAQAAILSHLAHTRSMISPSLSSAGSGSEDADPDRRRELSPSPEVDLSSPEFDDMDDDVPVPSTPIGSLSIRGSFSAGTHLQRHASSRGRAHRATSPPLERDEKEFTQTADGLQKRKLSGDLLPGPPPASQEPVATVEVDLTAKDDGHLFGEKMHLPASLLGANSTLMSSFASSPAIRPSSMALNLGKKDNEADGWAKLDQLLEWDRSPETIELEELDCLLSGY